WPPTRPRCSARSISTATMMYRTLEKSMSVSTPPTNGNGHLDIDEMTQLAIPGAEPGHRRSDAEIAAAIEAMLYVATEPPSVTELAAGAELEPEEIERGLTRLAEGASGRGLVIQRHGDRISLGTAPRLAACVRKFLGLDREARIS